MANKRIQRELNGVTRNNAEKTPCREKLETPKMMTGPKRTGVGRTERAGSG